MSRFMAVYCVLAGAVLAGQVGCPVYLGTLRLGSGAWRNDRENDREAFGRSSRSPHVRLRLADWLGDRRMRGPLPIPGLATEQPDKDHDVGEPPTLSRQRGCCRTEPPQCSQEA